MHEQSTLDEITKRSETGNSLRYLTGVGCRTGGFVVTQGRSGFAVHQLPKLRKLGGCLPLFWSLWQAPISTVLNYMIPHHGI